MARLKSLTVLKSVDVGKIVYSILRLHDMRRKWPRWWSLSRVSKQRNMAFVCWWPLRV